MQTEKGKKKKVICYGFEVKYKMFILYHMASEWVLKEFIFVNSFFIFVAIELFWMLSDGVKRIIVWHEVDSVPSQLTTHKQLANLYLETHYSSSQIES